MATTPFSVSHENSIEIAAMCCFRVGGGAAWRPSISRTCYQSPRVFVTMPQFKTGALPRSNRLPEPERFASTRSASSGATISR